MIGAGDVNMASKIPTEKPIFANVTARFAVTVDYLLLLFQRLRL
jgi:hypothetical protein